MNEQIVEYIDQNRHTYTREAITSQLVTAGYNPADVEAAWHLRDTGSPIPPSEYSGVTGLSESSWDSGATEQPRRRRFINSPAFWGYLVGFIVLSYLLPGLLIWLGASQSNGAIANVALGMFLVLQLGALVGGLVSLGRNRPRAVGLMVGVLMVVVVLPTCAAALLFGMCLASLSGARY